MQQLLNHKEQLFFEYMQGGPLPQDTDLALEFVVLAGQIHKAFEAEDNYLNYGTPQVNSFAVYAKF